MFTVEQVREVLRDTFVLDPMYDQTLGATIKIRPRITCMDGFSFSMQASDWHYCIPRLTLRDCEYEAVELGYPSEIEDLIKEFAEDVWWEEEPREIDYTSAVYPCVPLEVVAQVIDKHGGLKV